MVLAGGEAGPLLFLTVRTTPSCLVPRLPACPEEREKIPPLLLGSCVLHQYCQASHQGLLRHVQISASSPPASQVDQATVMRLPKPDAG